MTDDEDWRKGLRGGKLVVTRKGERLGGRQKGTPNKTSSVVKQAAFKAAVLTGEDGFGKDGLVGYVRFLASKHPRAYARLLGRIVSAEVNEERGGRPSRD